MASGLALAVYGLLLVPAAVLVWRRPVFALYAWVVGLAAHNVVMAALYGAGVRGGALTAFQAWKEILLGVALARIAFEVLRTRRTFSRSRSQCSCACMPSSRRAGWAAQPIGLRSGSRSSTT